MSNLFPLEEFSRFVVHELPHANNNENHKQLEGAFSLVPDLKSFESFLRNSNYTEKVVAMGDLGIYLVSLKKNELSLDTTTLEENLLLASYYTGLAPRDTYSSYITYNPSNALRTFTNHESEIGFINKHKSSDEALKDAVNKLFDLQQGEHQNVTVTLAKTIKAIEHLIIENKDVHNHVSPPHFISFFRHYFFPLTIKGIDYQAPSGVHISNIILLDLIIGSADDNYLETTNSLLTYLEPFDKIKIMKASIKPSIKSRFLQKDIPYNNEDVSMLIEIFRCIKIYRYVHQGLVTRYIRRQSPETTNGTGGFPFDTFLKERVDMVKKVEDNVQKHFSRLLV
ncbi:monodechloroaminopyrrolnitrin synthase PrnB family protein [Alkalihalobacterium alkalicellulosilyticum]|uniref:monodechloroaminopyrrolnitrin synthase PrnB family protein n=1 Tax=Alkalihalobacterium alkalicellulosilyticum TaxID=1912214 RepID=UPI000996EB93|nr:monodechloroaminopyrrolnitrin synthase PrnB family protein [Bacillus alkalicellulosilyticus]